jgi:hypothetical protein
MTDVACTVPDEVDPATATNSPALTFVKVGRVTPASSYVVEEVTSTVVVDPLWPLMVKVFEPTTPTVPAAAGLAPPNQCPNREAPFCVGGEPGPVAALAMP